MKLLRPVLKGYACTYCRFKTTSKKAYHEHVSEHRCQSGNSFTKIVISPDSPITSNPDLIETRIEVLPFNFVVESNEQAVVTDYVGVDPFDIERFEKVNNLVH